MSFYEYNLQKCCIVFYLHSICIRRLDSYAKQKPPITIQIPPADATISHAKVNEQEKYEQEKEASEIIQD